MSIEVVSVCNRDPRPFETYYRPDLFHKSLARHGFSATVLGFGEHWGGLMTKPRRLRQWLRDGKATADLIIVSDVFDVVFAESPRVVEQRYREEIAPGLDAVVFNAERGLFPRGDLARAFPEAATPFRYLNSGFFVGPPLLLLQMLEAMWMDDIHDDWQMPDGRWVHPNDQGWYQALYAMQPVKMRLDHHGALCQCASACSLDEFTLETDSGGPTIRNNITGAYPPVWHFNGGSKNDIMPAFTAHWGLE